MDGKTSPKLWAIVTVLVAVISCVGLLGAAFIEILPSLLNNSERTDGEVTRQLPTLTVNSEATSLVDTFECIYPTELINKQGWTNKGGPVDKYGGWNVELLQDDFLPVWWEALGERKITQYDPERKMTTGIWTIYTPFKNDCRKLLGFQE